MYSKEELLRMEQSELVKLIDEGKLEYNHYYIHTDRIVFGMPPDVEIDTNDDGPF